MLVLDEAFDTWEHPKNAQDYHLYFNDWWQRDIDAWVMRDRNHPSVIMWSIGNEINDLGSARGIADGTKLACARQTTRLHAPGDRCRAALQWHGPARPQLDLERRRPAAREARYRGLQLPDGEIQSGSPARAGPSNGGDRILSRDMFDSWQWAADNTWVIGDFIWTGWDYLGESGIGRVQATSGRGGAFPYHGAYCGDIDLAGFRKPQSHARNITWDRGEKMYTSVIEQGADGGPLRTDGWGTTPSRESWTWPGMEGKSMDVQVYSRYEAVRVSLNGTMVDEKPTGRSEQFKAVISVPYAPGTLKTEGIVGGKVVATSEIKTVGPVAKLRLTADRNRIHADGQDLSFITVESVDADGNFQPNGDQEVTFDVSGAGALAGVANGDLNNADGYQAKSRKLFQGRALLIVRATHQPGAVEIRAIGEGLPEASMTIDCAMMWDQYVASKLHDSRSPQPPPFAMLDDRWVNVRICSRIPCVSIARTITGASHQTTDFESGLQARVVVLFGPARDRGGSVDHSLRDFD